MAINSSLLETSIEGARGILLNISGGKDLSLHEVNEVAEIINAAADPEANIIFGAVVDESLGDALWVTVVAAGFDATSEEVLTEQVESAARLHHPAERQAPGAGSRSYGGTSAPAAPGAGAPPREATRDVSREAPRRGQTEAGGSDNGLEIPPFLR